MGSKGNRRGRTFLVHARETNSASYAGSTGFPPLAPQQLARIHWLLGRAARRAQREIRRFRLPEERESLKLHEERLRLGSDLDPAGKPRGGIRSDPEGDRGERIAQRAGADLVP